MDEKRIHYLKKFATMWYNGLYKKF